jgi:NADPH:quinone reductase-like Zn-dependent oxidoreductase
VLSSGGKLVAYAMMSGEATAPGDLRFLMREEISLDSLYRGSSEHRAKIPEIVRQAASMIDSCKIRVPVAAVYPLSAVGEAISHVERGGKILLHIGDWVPTEPLMDDAGGW